MAIDRLARRPLGVRARGTVRGGRLRSANPVACLLAGHSYLRERLGELARLDVLYEQGADEQALRACWGELGGREFIAEIRETLADAEEGANRVRDPFATYGHSREPRSSAASWTSTRRSDPPCAWPPPSFDIGLPLRPNWERTWTSWGALAAHHKDVQVFLQTVDNHVLEKPFDFAPLREIIAARSES